MMSDKSVIFSLNAAVFFTNMIAMMNHNKSWLNDKNEHHNKTFTLILPAVKMVESIPLKLLYEENDKTSKW